MSKLITVWLVLVVLALANRANAYSVEECVKETRLGALCHLTEPGFLCVAKCTDYIIQHESCYHDWIKTYNQCEQVYYRIESE